MFAQCSTLPSSGGMKKRLPILNAGYAGRGWNKRFAVVQPDFAGSMEDVGGFQHVCLLTALRALGINVPIKRNGPFRALADGNPLMAPLGYTLTHTPSTAIATGKYVKWHAGHFTAVEVEECVRVVDNGVARVYNSPTDVGRADEHLWYRLSKIGEEVKFDRRLGKASVSSATSLPPPQSCSGSSGQVASAPKRMVAVGSHMTPEELSRIKRNRAEAEALRASQLIRPHPPSDSPRVQVPPAPVAFGGDLHLPKVPFLHSLNHHERDDRLTFYSDTHTYLIDGCRNICRNTSTCIECRVQRPLYGFTVL